MNKNEARHQRLIEVVGEMRAIRDRNTDDGSIFLSAITCLLAETLPRYQTGLAGGMQKLWSDAIDLSEKNNSYRKDEEHALAAERVREIVEASTSDENINNLSDAIAGLQRGMRNGDCMLALGAVLAGMTHKFDRDSRMGLLFALIDIVEVVSAKGDFTRNPEVKEGPRKQ